VITEAARWKDGIPKVKKFWFEVTSKFPPLSKLAPLPLNASLEYDVFRKRLIDNGWKPFDSGNEYSYYRDRPFGWIEVDSCTGSYIHICRFRFTDDNKNMLIVIAMGEPDPPMVVNFWIEASRDETER